MKKMAVLVSVENGCAAEKVMKAAKSKLGLKKGGRVISKDGRRVLFVSGIIQRSVAEVEELSKYKNYDMIVIPSFAEGVKEFPKIQDVKMFTNNILGFSIFVCAVPPSPDAKQVEDASDNIVDIVTANAGL